MSAKYTIQKWPSHDSYDVVNPSGVHIAFQCSWRVARKIADLYNADVEWRRHSELNAAFERGAVSLQEEA